MSLPVPYYSDDKITLYNCEWEEVIADLPKIDLTLTDPPYGISLPTDFKSRRRGGLSECRTDYPEIKGDDHPFDPSPFLTAPRVILWGANYFADKLPISSGWLTWDKRCKNGFHNDQADGELAWTNCIKGVRIFRHMWSGFLRDSERGDNWHPMQKPVALMGWCLNQVKDIDSVEYVFDPFSGCGPVPIACKMAGKKCIACERVEQFCEHAAKRLSQGVLDLFTEQPLPLGDTKES